MRVEQAATVAERATPATAQPPAPSAQHRVAGGIPSRSFTSVSLTSAETVKPVVSLEEREAEQLTQERLEELWQRLVEESKDDAKLHELIADKHVVLKNNNLFHIEVSNMRFDTLLRDYQDRILAPLRAETHNEALCFKAVVVVDQEVRTVAYLPRDKFDRMVEINPAILQLRKLFPDIDF